MNRGKVSEINNLFMTHQQRVPCITLMAEFVLAEEEEEYEETIHSILLGSCWVCWDLHAGDYSGRRTNPSSISVTQVSILQIVKMKKKKWARNPFPQFKKTLFLYDTLLPFDVVICVLK